MKLSDYIANFLVSQGITHVFVISGGAAVHMVDSIDKHPKISYICTTHEQHAGAAADGYARVRNSLGAVIVTSGPGATNLATSIANSYFDSIPVLFLCGQVATFRLRPSRKLRQKGFQETDVVGMYSPITKYAVELATPTRIKYELEKAVYRATTGRPGPVVVSIPDDLSRSEIDPTNLAGFNPPKPHAKDGLRAKIRALVGMVQRSKRPILIFGSGIGISRMREDAIRFARYLAMPVLHTWSGADVMDARDPLSVGPLGVCGPRSGNFAVQNADLVIAIGTRLSHMVTGGKPNLFAPRAKKVMVDIDTEELNKFRKDEFTLDLRIEVDLRDFFPACRALYKKRVPDRLKSWRRQIQAWEKDYPVCPSSYYTHEKQIQPHVFVKELSKVSSAGDIIVGDTGANLSWIMQAWETKPEQRIFSAWSHSPMGYALPAALGAAFATRRNILCLIGDGGLMMCLGELATVVRHKLPLKIFVFNNHGHSIQKQTIDTWLASRYNAADVASGLAFPDFEKVGVAFGLPAVTLRVHRELPLRLRSLLRSKGAVLVNVEIDPDARIVPMLTFGAGLEDLNPKLPPNELSDIMAVSRDE